MSAVQSKGMRLAFAQPLYSQVRTQLLIRVKSGEWSAGEALPNEFALASQYGVSIGTIRRSIEGLEEQGVLVRKQGRGTYIAGDGRNALQEKFTALRTPSGATPDVRYQIEKPVRRACTSDEAEALGCSLTSEIIEIEQGLFLNDELLGIERAIVSAAVFPRLETQLTYGQHLYAIYCQYGVLVTQTWDVVSVEIGPHVPQGRLCLDTGGAVLAVRRRAYTHDRQPVEYRISHYLPSKVTYASAIG